jgi:hypothetical protein
MELNEGLEINPATGLCMVDGGVDICGNVYGDDGSSFYHDVSTFDSCFDDGFINDACFDDGMSFNDDSFI